MCKSLEVIVPKEAIPNDWTQRQVGHLYKVPAGAGAGFEVAATLRITQWYEVETRLSFEDISRRKLQ